MRRALFALGMATIAACAGSKEAKKPVAVSDSDYGRLTSAQTAVVDQARMDLGNARDGLARAKLRQTEASQAMSLAAADIDVAEAEKKRAEARMKLARESNDPAQLAEAQSMTEGAQLRLGAAQARRDFAQKLQAAHAAAVAAEEKRVAMEEARVEQAKLLALYQAQVPAAGKYDGSQLDARLAAARKELQEATSKAQSAVNAATAAEQRWHDLDRQLQARSVAPLQRG